MGRFLVWLLACISLSSSCTAAEPQAGLGISGEYPVSTLEKGDSSAITEKVTAVIRNDQDWQKLWSKHVAEMRPKPKAATIDFKQAVVIAVFNGEKPSSGFAVNVDSVGKRANKVIVKVKAKKPPRGSSAASVMTQPYHIVKTPLFQEEAEFEFVPD